MRHAEERTAAAYEPETAAMVADPAPGAAWPTDAGAGTGAVRVAAALRRLARREDVKSAVLGSGALYPVLLRAAARYVAGETRAEAVATARALAKAGHRVTVDFMGEDTRDAAVARAAVDEFLALVGALGPAGAAESPLLRAASVSLDLSHVGLAVPGKGERLAGEHLAEIAAAAEAVGREVILSMEDSARTDAVLAAHAAVAERHPNLGVTLQAALHRTPADLARVLPRPGRVRLVKGAYAEPPDVAHGRGPGLDAAYAALARTLVAAAAERARPCSVATHDPALLEGIVGAADSMGGAAGIAEDALQFEMLHGVTPARLDALRARGYATRVYLVYGHEWYLYLCHRLAEHPPAIFDALADAVDAMPPGPDGADAAGGAPRTVASSARPGRRTSRA